MPERINYWGIPTTWGSPSIYVYTLMAIGTIILLVRFFLRARIWWRVGRPEMRWDKLHIRVVRVIQYAILQLKLLRQKYPGLMHLGLAWGFFVFFLGTALATINSDFVKFLQGNIYLVYKFVLDTFTLFFLIGAGMAAYRRFIQRPPRLSLTSGFTWSLVLATIIVLGGLTIESFRLAVERPSWALWSPFGWLVAQAWIATGAPNATLLNWHLGVWIFHLLCVSLLFATLPASTLLHVVAAPLNIFFSKLDRPTGRLAPLPTNTAGEPRYTTTLRDLTWKQLLDSDTCTECGRCQDECPAYASGKPLSPKEVILGIRTALRQEGTALLKQDAITSPLVGERIADDVLWSCTTCGACVRECPVLIEHVDAIVDMRRYLVIEGRMDTELQNALENLGRYGNSFGQSERMRARWSQPLQPPIKDARREPVEYLWFVGDYASYSPTLTDITLKTAEVFRNAGLDYGILYDAERNAGNDVRRVGEEGLFEMLVEKNTTAMGKCTFQSIVTTDPHTLNTLKNEYFVNGNDNHPVLHYTELLDQLILSGRLKFSKKLGYKVTYHDPCYLGRYNGIYDAPRRIIRATGCELVEMKRHADRSFCCGAGGGRIWMKEGEIKERPSESRIREAAALPGVTSLVVACPKDLTMYRDAVKTTGNEQRLMIQDLIELVHAAL
jgi:Fe-S oxidoreductase/nitrate reductase gamma subunit